MSNERTYGGTNVRKLCAFALLLCFLLGPIAGEAQSYFTITQLQESLPERWTETYKTKWRTVEIDVQPIVPKVENIPILKVTPDLELPDISPLGEGWTSKQDEEFGIFYLLLNGGTYPQVHRAEKELGGVTTGIHHFPPYDMDRVYAENSDITLGNAIDRLKSVFAAIGEDPEDWWYDRPSNVLCNKTVKNKTGKYLLEGDYTIYLDQQISGIPLLCCYVNQTVKRSMKEEIGFNAGLLFSILTPEALDFCLSKVKIAEVLSEDVPLCDFSSVQAALEKEIKAGHIRKIFDFDLGYALYNEPGAVRGPDHPRGAIYYALPVWRVNCHYVENAKKGMRDYTGLDVPERAVAEYMTLLVNAQTGKLIDRADKSKGAGAYKGFISWDKAGGKP